MAKGISFDLRESYDGDAVENLKKVQRRINQSNVVSLGNKRKLDSYIQQAKDNATQG